MPRIYIILAFIAVRYAFIIYRQYLDPKVRRMKRVIPELLSLYSVYYRNLNPKEQKHFEKRVLMFISVKKFYRFDKTEATDEMKILIAAAAVQITFGFSDSYEYEIFRNIAISDKGYISSQTQKVHQGEANPGKSLIAFSWERFMEGVKSPNHPVNLGLHEFAHALYLNNMKGHQNPHFCNSIGDWHATTQKLMKEQTIRDFFRSYAFVNNMELFAVSVEYFFESPKDFHVRLPQLYSVMCRLLNQNPLLQNNGITRK